MSYFGRFILLLINIIVGLPYIFYNYMTLKSICRFLIDIIVFIVVSAICYLLGKTYDKLNFYQQELENSHREFQEIFDNINVVLWSSNLINKQTTVSKRASDLFGYKTEDFSKNYHLFTEAAHPEDKELVNKYYQELLSGKESVAEYRIIRSDGQIRWIQSNGKPVFNKSGNLIKLVGTTVDITERKLAEQNIHHVAYHDTLTDLPNRRFLYEYLNKAFARSKRNNQGLSILFLDLDGFKDVNDKYGHEAGDILLKQVSQRLKNNIRENDIASRLGGDEFLIVLENSDKNQTLQIADRIIKSVSEPYTLNNNDSVFFTVSIGISLYPQDGNNPEILINKADKAMFSAKKRGKNDVKFYTHDLD
ncbi:sensor domain-containing diguanylate cyclase [Clostridium sp. SYSU_GA19001]|uniref:sensor domain-containing protein n=1 Tax=Clostridium caldaquaticum TaxID=2940653 RepID=UPI0020772F70|nr:sensor domain-containing diguanylate cyclase [Clostridium caldaquaticum]MCM8709423.1 sensor domain-containing diguanylate cyclase [Clostridium caldaquaticum]